MSRSPEATPRCDRHVGETYPPRCYDCDALAAEYADTNEPTTDPESET